MNRWRWLALGLWGLYALFAIAGLARVPFHPDESTHLFTSQDWELYGNPTVAWRAEGSADLMQHYRLIDAPFSRYTVGFTRALLGFAPLPNDWNWSLTWDENAERGALPSPALLWVGRFPALLWLLITPALLFQLGQRLGGEGTGLLAAVLYALNALILLHARRAMSESPMLLFNVLALTLLARRRVNPVPLGVCAALAVSAKLTGLVVAAVSLGGLLLGPINMGQRARSVGLWLLAFVSVVWLFHPVLWANPLPALNAMWQERQAFLAAQVATLQAVAPNALLSPPARALAIAYHVYLAPLQFWEAPNYAVQTAPSEGTYGVHLHALGRAPQPAQNFLLGGLGFALTLVGLALALRPKPAPPARQHFTLVLALWTLLTALSLLSFPVAWQRYYLPLIPCLCLWTAYAVVAFVRPLVHQLRKSSVFSRSH